MIDDLPEGQTQYEGGIGQSASTAGLGDDRGHYFDFQRGEYYRNADGKVVFVQASGLVYVGALTRTQRDELDTIILAYVNGMKAPTPN